MKSGPCVLFVALLYVAPAVSQICNLNDPEGGGLFVPAFGSGGAHWCVNNSTENEPTVYVNPDGCENTHCATICVPAENDVQAWGVLYCVLLLWCFLGVGIIADKFMEAIGVVTSKSTLIEKEDKGTGQTHQYEIMTWNATVANLTLMALGSSAPEILLNVIEICSGGFYAGALGPGTIVGSAAFNLFIIIAVCVMVLPDGETRKIADMKVFGITAFSSVFAYLWLLIILMAWTPNVVTLEEAIITFLFFPLLVILAFMADKGVFSKRNSVAPSVLTGVAHIEHQYDDETGKLTKTVAAETFTPGQVKAALMKNHSLIKPGADPNLLAMEVFKKSKPMTRADYFNQAGRKLRGVKDTGMAVVTATEDRASRVGFKCTEWKESEGEESVTLTVQRFGYMKDALTVEYATESGSATAGADFLTVTGEAQFEPDQIESHISIRLVDDNTYEKNEHFFVKLGKLSHADAQLNGERATSKVTIVSDDPEPPVLNMRETEGNTLSKLSATYDILESAGHVNVAVVRTGDHSKRCSCEYATKGGTATPGADYEETEGTLVFDPGQTVKYIEVKIVDNDEFEHNEEFTVTIRDPEGATLGTIVTAVVTIINDDEITEVVERVAQLLKLDLDKYREGGRNWRNQFVDAVFPDGACMPTGCVNKILHILNLPWNLIFALCPPTVLCGGYLCFCISLMMIGFVTVLIGDLAGLFGCAIGLKDSVTAITFVALGTSLPDTFASKAAAMGDATADNSVGNVTGSNSVNVFLGLGLPWLIAAIFWAVADDDEVRNWHSRYSREFASDPGVLKALAENPGGAFLVPAGDLGFSVICFSCGAVLVLGGLMLRRKLYGVELGGPRKTLFGLAFICVWFVYVALSCMKTYGVI